MDNAQNPPQSEALPIETPNHRVIAGFWRRLAAFIIDVILLAVFGELLSLVLFDFFSSLGVYGPLFGYSIALAYFGYLNSGKGHGQTFGKRWLKIEVVDSEGKHLALTTSLLRYGVLSFPFFIHPDMLPDALRYSWFSFLLGGIFGFWLLVIAYLFACNRRTRQSLHDLAVNSYVVDAFSIGPVQPYSLGKGHFAVLGFLLLAGILSCFLIQHYLPKETFTQLLNLQKRLMQTGQFSSADLTVGKNYYFNNGERSEQRSLQVRVLCKRKFTEPSKVARDVATVVLKNYPEIQKQDAIVITVRRGFNIGICSSNISRTYSHKPEQWQAYLEAPNTPLELDRTTD